MTVVSRLDLPTSSSRATMAMAWRCLQERYGQLPEDLALLSLNHYAMLAWLCAEWDIRKESLSTDEVYSQLLKDKLLPEVCVCALHRISTTAAVAVLARVFSAAA